jgi:hypothetical protein
LGQAVAAERIKDVLARVSRQYAEHVTDVEQEWQQHTLQFRFRAMGFKIAGTLQSHDESVACSCQLPLAAMIVRGKIETTLREELEKLLGGAEG